MYKYNTTDNVTIDVIQKGDMISHAQNILLIQWKMNNLQPTGLYAIPGDIITVYADIENTKYMPSIVFTQNEGSMSSWQTRVGLKPGKNEIRVPQINTSAYSIKVKNGGAIYLENFYEEYQQGKSPKVTISGAKRYPYYKKGDNVEKFKEFLIQYYNALNEDNKNNGNRVIDIAEVESDRMILSVAATGAYDTFIKDMVNPEDTTIFWDDVMNEALRFHGMDGSGPKHDPKGFKENIRLMQPNGYMYSTCYFIGIQRNEARAALNPQSVMSSSWGFMHEISHKLETKYSYPELSTNVFTMHMQDIFKTWQNRVNYDDVVYPRVAPDNRIPTLKYELDLGSFWQLQIYNRNFWTQLSKLHRELHTYDYITLDPTLKANDFLEEASEVLKLDLGEYVLRHGFKPSKETLDAVAKKYQKPTKKLWYLNETSYKYNGPSVSDAYTVKLHNDFSENIYRYTIITFESNVPAEQLLGYEIIRNGEVIGFTTKTIFADQKIREEHKKYDYKVVAYGKDLSKTGESNTLSIGVDKEIVITRQISLTDFPAKSARQSYSFPKKNLSVSGKKIVLTDENGNPIEYNSGIGAHSTSEIVYDLSKLDYITFTSYIGIDREMYNSIASVVFEVYVDNIKKYDSGIMYGKDPQKFLKVDITGAKELKLVVTDGRNGDGSDHANWANPQLHYPDDMIIEGELAKYVDIEDEVLRDEIKRTLNIKSDKITIAQMYQLTDVTLERGYVKKLKGIEYAQNLEKLNIDYNEIRDISPLNKLPNLKSFSGLENFYLKPGQLKAVNGKFIINDNLVDIDGQQLVIKEVRVGTIFLNVEDVLVNGQIIINSKVLERDKGSVEILYESQLSNFAVYVLTLLYK